METSGDWNLNVQECALPERFAGSGRTIAELAVRARHGCSITEINRQGHTIVAPEPKEALYSGDRLLLLGTSAQIAAARADLARETAPGGTPSFDEARLETVRVPAGPRAGETIAALQIPRTTGVLVAGHLREGRRVVNPPPTEVLREGDELLVLGAPRNIKAFKRWLRGDDTHSATSTR
jgi:CPA2 family monovalent cation:H+ antiporter-2